MKGRGLFQTTGVDFFFASQRLAILRHCCLHYYNGWEDKKDKKDKLSFFLRATGS